VACDSESVFFFDSEPLLLQAVKKEADSAIKITA
jgi:hypothetical protein